MNVRIGVVAVRILTVGVLTAACSSAAGPPIEPSSAPGHPASSAGPLEPATPPVRWLRVSPELVAPGSTVSLNVACLDKLGPVSSPALDIGPLKGNPDGHQPWNLFGAATVHSNAAPGPYRVSATCGPDELSAPVTVTPPA
ncbi:MAG TPA: hypothetical protein VIY28_06125 [Pseudonocardiaceae bacterium]